MRLIAHSALHGLSYERTSGRFAATARLVELAEAAAAAEGDARDPDAVDPRIVVASVVALFVGWISADDWILRAAGLRDRSDEEIVDGLERVMLQLLRENFPAAGGMPRPSDAVARASVEHGLDLSRPGSHIRTGSASGSEEGA